MMIWIARKIQIMMSHENDLIKLWWLEMMILMWTTKACKPWSSDLMKYDDLDVNTSMQTMMNHTEWSEIIKWVASPLVLWGFHQ